MILITKYTHIYIILFMYQLQITDILLIFHCTKSNQFCKTLSLISIDRYPSISSYLCSFRYFLILLKYIFRLSMSNSCDYIITLRSQEMSTLIEFFFLLLSVFSLM